MSCTKSDFSEIAQPRRRRDRGIGERPNKQENVRPRESGSRAFSCKCIYTCIACRFPAAPLTTEEREKLRKRKSEGIGCMNSKKPGMETRNAAIHAEETARGVFVHVGDLPKHTPKTAVQSTRPTV